LASANGWIVDAEQSIRRGEHVAALAKLQNAIKRIAQARRQIRQAAVEAINGGGQC
jgi:methyl coenzyme M reductase subunit C-like uncharacterized protein (methanogenesis marker protein 7)